MKSQDMTGPSVRKDESTTTVSFPNGLLALRELQDALTMYETEAKKGVPEAHAALSTLLGMIACELDVIAQDLWMRRHSKCSTTA